jgi:4-amino-4-deoxy-L-arabinose transferase-like glycosyltransferase
LTAITLRIPTNGFSVRWQRAVLCAIYVGLAAYFLVFNVQPIWFTACGFLALVSAFGWWWGRRGEALATGWVRIDRSLCWAADVPPLFLALPLPMIASWFAGQIAIAELDTNYWTALGLWLGAIAVFVGLLFPWRALARPIDLRALLAAVPWWEVVGVSFLTLVAFGARVVDIVDEPSPFSGDEANFSNQALEVLRGTRENMFGTGVPFGQPALYYFLLAGVFKVFGVGVLESRMLTVVFGVTMVPMLYVLLREMFSDRRIAFAGAAFLAVYHFHIHFSRAGLNNMSAAWIAVACLLFAARATRTRSPLDFGLAGAMAGLSLYSFVAARAVPPVLGLYFAWVVLFNWRFLRANAGNFLVLIAGFVIVAAPQGLFFINTPDDWYAGHRWANIFGNGYYDAQREAGRGAIDIMFTQFRDGFGVLANISEVYHHYNPGTPLIDPRKWGPLPGLMFWFFLAGGLISLYHMRQARYFAFLALLLVTMLLGAVTVFPTVSSARLVTMAPAVAAIVAIGLVGTVDAVARWRPQTRWLAPALFGGALLVFTFINIQFYFGDYLPNDRYVVGDNDVTFAAGEYMHDLGPEWVGYWFGLPRIYTLDPTMNFLGRDRVFVEVRHDATLMPVHKGSEPNATFMFLPERIADLEQVREACPGGQEHEVYEPYDERVLFTAYELPGGQACVTDNPIIFPREDVVEQPPAEPRPTTADPAQLDAQRREDLEEIRVALEAYYDEEEQYPSTLGSFQTLCAYVEADAGCAIEEYIDPIPQDPLGDPIRYGYFYASDGQRFSVFSLLEGPAEPLTVEDCPFYDPNVVDPSEARLCVSGSRE